MKVMIAVPSRDTWKSDFGMSLAAMCCATIYAIPGLELVMNNAKGCSLSMNRIDLCKKAMERGCDFILFLDDDMRIPMETLSQLVSHQKDIIGANCATRAMPPSPTARNTKKELVFTRLNSTGLEEVRSVGTGVLLIRAAVLARLPQPWFWEDPVNRIGEDVNFCLKAREYGLKVFIDHDLSKKVIHIGEMDYSHDLMPEWGVSDAD